MINEIYWVIRHKATREVMPQMKRDRGYSHWNPGNPSNDKPMASSLGVPRLFSKLKSANLARKFWVSMPNASYGVNVSYNGDESDTIKTHDDGRKLEDIEVIKVELAQMEW